MPKCFILVAWRHQLLRLHGEILPKLSQDTEHTKCLSLGPGSLPDALHPCFHRTPQSLSYPVHLPRWNPDNMCISHVYLVIDSGQEISTMPIFLGPNLGNSGPQARPNSLAAWESLHCPGFYLIIISTSSFIICVSPFFLLRLCSCLHVLQQAGCL